MANWTMRGDGQGRVQWFTFSGDDLDRIRNVVPEGIDANAFLCELEKSIQNPAFELLKQRAGQTSKANKTKQLDAHITKTEKYFEDVQNMKKLFSGAIKDASGEIGRQASKVESELIALLSLLESKQRFYRADSGRPVSVSEAVCRAVAESFQAFGLKTPRYDGSDFWAMCQTVLDILGLPSKNPRKAICKT